MPAALAATRDRGHPAGIAAAAATETGFSTANKAALALLDEKLRTNPDLYPSEEEQKRLHLPKALDQKALKLWSQAWDRAKGPT